MTDTHPGDLLAFPAAEYAVRIAAARAAMAEQGLDAFVVSSAENLFYLTGFASLAWGRTVLVLPLKEAPVWVMRLTELSNIRALHEVLWAKAAIGVPDTQDFSAALASAIAARTSPGARIGVEAATAPSSLRGFTQLLPAIVDSSGLVEKLRRTKSPAEIALMRQAGRIVRQSTDDAFEALRDGMTDSDLAAILTASLIRHGSDRVAQMPNVAAGPRTARAHITWGHLPIERGDLITVEPAACVVNYHAPIYRIMSLGEPAAEARRMFDACRAAFEAGWQAVRPGMTSNDAAAIYEGVLRRAGYADRMVTRPAYSIGIAFPPGWGEDNVMSIRSGDETVLEAGMCFHICPCLYEDGIGCLCASMPAVLTETGFSSLSGGEVELMAK
jgi:Xaa-Pro dipeptidase